MSKPKKLTPIAIDAIKPTAARQEIRDAGCAGLYLVVQPAPSGSKSWAYRYRHNGKPKKLTLGTWFAGEGECPTVALGMPLTLAGARKLAVDAASQVASGIDPAAARFNDQRAAEQRDADKIENAISDFIRLHAKRHTKEYSARQAERFLNYEVVSKWRGRAVQSVTRRDIIQLLDAIVERGSPISANRTLSHLSKFFSWCVGRDIIETSPCIGIARPSPEKARERVLTDDELKLVWFASDKVDGPFGALVKMLILTLQRRGEVAGMARRELEGDIWTIPAARAKNSVETVVPLSPEALSVLATVQERGAYVFTVTGEKPMTSFYRSTERLNTAIAALNGGKPLEHWTVHDLRRTGATGMQKLGTPMHVTEKILNHTGGSFKGIVKVYQKFDYADERRAALEAWSRHVMSLTVANQSLSKVLNFSRK